MLPNQLSVVRVCVSVYYLGYEFHILQLVDSFVLTKKYWRLDTAYHLVSPANKVFILFFIPTKKKAFWKIWKTFFMPARRPPPGPQSPEPAPHPTHKITDETWHPILPQGHHNGKKYTPIKHHGRYSRWLGAIGAYAVFIGMCVGLVCLPQICNMNRHHHKQYEPSSLTLFI